MVKDLTMQDQTQKGRSSAAAVPRVRRRADQRVFFIMTTDYYLMTTARNFPSMQPAAVDKA